MLPEVVARLYIATENLWIITCNLNSSHIAKYKFSSSTTKTGCYILIILNTIEYSETTLATIRIANYYFVSFSVVTVKFSSTPDDLFFTIVDSVAAVAATFSSSWLFSLESFLATV